VNIADLRLSARRRLPRVVFDYLDGGAEGEFTLRENCNAFEEVTFRPRHAVAVPKCELRTRVLGCDLSFPVVLAPESAAKPALDHGPVCFDRPSAHEILLGGRKLVGSAQVRRATAILQHGSILIEPRIDRLLACLRLPDRPETRIEDGVAGLAEVGDFDPMMVAGALADAFAEEFGVQLARGRLSPDERRAAGALAASKFGAIAWSQGRPEMVGRKTTRTR